MATDVPPLIRVYDGDTFHYGKETIRFLNIDAPEMPRGAKCDAEAFLALAAKERLSALLLGAGQAVQIERNARKDKYGRTLALVRIKGADVGEMLIAAHLAVRWAGKRHNWCVSRSN